MIIGVIGSNECDTQTEMLAEKTGALIAQKGHRLICGGLGGVMQAACRGAKKYNGLTIGILPGASARDKNKYVDIPIVTAMSHARNAIIVRTADVLIAVSGRFGTLSEIALARAIHKPVIGIKTWDIEGVIGVETPEAAVEQAERIT